MPGRVDEASGSKFTRMWFSDDMQHLNFRREHIAHLVHYKMNIHEMKALAKQLGRPVDMLDVGCGEANTVRMFYTADQSRKTDVIASYTGLEGDGKCVERTQERAATVLRGINGGIELCDITKGRFPVERESIDFLICNEVLEHIPQRAVLKVLRAMHRATHPDSVLMVSTPNKEGTNAKLPADHVYEWGYDELASAIAEAGFEVLDQRGVYIKKDRLLRHLRANQPELVDWASEIWDRYGNDIGSMMTADWAVPVANNIVWKLKKA